MKFSFTNSDVSKFVGLGRLEKYTIGQIMQGVKVFFQICMNFSTFGKGFIYKMQMIHQLHVLIIGTYHNSSCWFYTMTLD